MTDEHEINRQAETVAFPPKYEMPKPVLADTAFKSLLSLLFYIGLGYIFFRRVDVLLLIIFILLLHEGGHFIAMKYYRYNDVSVFFIPLLGAFVKGSKRETSQRQSAVILLAGPLPGIILGVLLFLINRNHELAVGNMPLGTIAMLLIIVNVINLLPVFPLDGGQLLNRVFLDEEGLVSNIFIILSGVLITWIAIYYKIYFLLIFPVMLIFRMVGTQKHLDLEKKMHEAGIDLDISYEDLSDAGYWKIRSVIIKNVPAYAGYHAGPPFEFDEKEEKIANEVETVLQRNLLQDASLGFKILIAAIWLLAIASPWLLNLNLPFSGYFIK